MEADDPFEARLSERLRTELERVAMPHPSWVSSPAALLISAGPAAPVRAIRVRWRRRTFVLLAAAALVVAGSAMIVLGGGGRSSTVPLAIEADPTPSTRPSDAAFSVSPTPDESIATPASTGTPAPCSSTWSQTATMTDAYPTGRRMELDRFMIGTGGSNGTGLYIILREPVSALPKISVAPAVPPFHDSTGKVISIAGSTYLKVTLDGLTRDYILPDNQDVTAGSRRGPGLVSVAPPILEMRRISNTGGTEDWILGLDEPVCLRPVIGYEFITDGQPAGDNVIFLGLDRRGP